MMQQWILWIISGCYLLPATLCAQTRTDDFFELDFSYPYRDNRGWLAQTDEQNALYHHLATQVYELMDKREKKVAKIDSFSDWQKRQTFLKKAILEATGPFPERTPLHAKILSSFRWQNGVVEHLVFESQPGFPVTASLYLPDASRSEPAPAIVYCSGHSSLGYRGETYQHFILNLMQKGFVVLAFDPLGQGERLQYLDLQTGEAHFKKVQATSEHSYPAVQALITGISQTTFMIWDGIRAIDYLMTRPEVDPSRLGITGGSGGGSQSAMIAAVDHRINAAAPERYLTSYRRLFETIGPQDGEQHLTLGLARGLDHADLLAVRAPRPALMVTTTNDFFSIQGARETAHEVERIYAAYHQPGNFRQIEDTASHASTPENRVQLYAFFQKHLALPGDSTDQPVEYPGEERLQVTETGQVRTSFPGVSTHDLIWQRAGQQQQALEAARTNDPHHLARVVESAIHCSGYREPGKLAKSLFAGQIKRDGYRIERRFLDGEGDYRMPYLLWIPDSGSSNEAILYLHPEGKIAQAQPGETIEQWVLAGYTVLSPDLPGLGQMGPGTFRGAPFIEGVSYNMLFGSMVIGRSITGIRAGEVVRFARCLHQQHGAKTVTAVAVDELGPVLLHAAAFEPAIDRVALIQPLISYQSLLREEYYAHRFVHSVVTGSHIHYDLPDLAAAIAPRPLLVGHPVTATGQPATTGYIDDEFASPRRAYRALGAENQLSVLPGDFPEQNWPSRIIQPIISNHSMPPAQHGAGLLTENTAPVHTRTSAR